MKIEIHTTDYINAHGKSPRGVGYWAFAIGSRTAEPTFFPQSSFADAKKAAAILAIALGVSKVWVCS